MNPLHFYGHSDLVGFDRNRHYRRYFSNIIMDPLLLLHGSPSPATAEPGKYSLITWPYFMGAIVASCFIHELGHCAVAWLHGYPAIPTPAKEYILKSIPANIQNQVALGGIAGSVVALLAGALWLYRQPTAISSALLAGAMTAPGADTLRFILVGRGHDATEFQEAQAALGLSFSGHVLDWLFLSLFVMATGFWFWRTRTRLSVRLRGRLVVGTLVALAVVVLLQSINNAVFDRIIHPKPISTAFMDMQA